MTLRLYYQDSALCEFSAKIIQKSDTKCGPAVLLDQTAFYPTSGGQPYDTGSLGDISVLDVWEDEEGRIWHTLERFPDGEVVSGLINWSRRFDHMQQHTGQHILSSAFLDELDANTIGFHLGAESSTIDLDIPNLRGDDVHKLEIIANHLVWENRLVKILFVEEDELDNIPFRKPPQVSGEIRVIWIDDYDASACGGTHVQYTGEVGLIKIIGTERYKGGVRVTFLCGQRALKDYHRVLKSIQHISTDLSIHQNDLGETINRLQEENKSIHRELSKTRKELMAHEAKRLWENTPEIDGVRKVASHWESYSFDDIRAISDCLRQNPKTLILLAATGGKNIRLICTRSDDLPDIDASVILKKAAERLGGRGGGSSAMALGGAPKSKHSFVILALQDAILSRKTHTID